MNSVSSCTRVLAVAIIAASCGMADTIFDFTLLPENTATNTAVVLTAKAGGTVGWGYSVTNLDDTDYLSLIDVQPTTNLQYGSADSSIFDFPIVAPGQTITMPWTKDAAGLAQFTWDANAPGSYLQGGQFVISATWYTEDPMSCGFACTEAYQTQTQALVPFAVSTVPEPAAFLLVGPLLAGILNARIARGRRA